MAKRKQETKQAPDEMLDIIRRCDPMPGALTGRYAVFIARDDDPASHGAVVITLVEGTYGNCGSTPGYDVRYGHRPVLAFDRSGAVLSTGSGLAPRSTGDDDDDFLYPADCGSVTMPSFSSAYLWATKVVVPRNRQAAA